MVSKRSVSGVRGLAVAMGVGAAIAIGQPVAAADAGDTESGPAKSESSENESTESESTEPTDTDTGDDADDSDDSGDGEDDEDDDSEEEDDEDSTEGEFEPTEPTDGDDEPAVDEPVIDEVPESTDSSVRTPVDDVAVEESAEPTLEDAPVDAPSNAVTTVAESLTQDETSSETMSLALDAARVVQPPQPPTVERTFFSLLAVVGLGPLALPGPGLPFTPAPLLEVIYAAWRYHRFVWHNEEPTGTVTVNDPDPVTGDITGAVVGDDEVPGLLTYELGQGPSRGEVELNDDGTFTYRPGAEITEVGGTDTFTVVISDEDTGFHLHRPFADQNHGTVVTVSITVAPAPVNEAPVETDDPTAEAPDRVTGVVTGTVSFEDPEGKPLKYDADVDPVKGTVTINDDGEFTFTPTADARVKATSATALESDKFTTVTITVTDDEGLATATTVRVAIQGYNQAPRPSGTTATLIDSETGVVTVDYPFVDPEGDDIEYTATVNPAKGTVTIGDDGSYVFTPTQEARDAAGKVGAPETDRFVIIRVTATDEYGATYVGGFRVPIVPNVNEAPEETADPTASEPDRADGTVTGTVSFEDPEGGPLTYSAEVDPTKGTVTTNEDGQLVFVPTESAREAAAAPGAGEDEKFTTIAVSVTDAAGLGTATLVRVAIQPANQAPVFEQYTYQVSASGEVTGRVTFDDPEDDALSFYSSLPATMGTLVIGPNGQFRFEPSRAARDAAAQAGAPESAKYVDVTVTAIDEYGAQGITVIRLPIAPTPNTAPTIESITVESQSHVTGETIGTVRATGPNPGDYLTYSVVSASGSTVTVSPDGRYTYVPNQATRDAAVDPTKRTDQITVTVTDRFGATVTQTFTVNVVPTNQAPVQDSAPRIVSTDDISGRVTGEVSVRDPEGQPLTITGSATKGTVVFNSSTGTFTYQPSEAARAAAAAPGAPASAKVDTVTYTATDPLGRSFTGQIEVAVAPETDILARWALPGSPQDIEVRADGVYVSTNNGIVVLDPVTGQVKRTLTTRSAFTTVVSSDGRYVYTAGLDSTSISKIDTQTGITTQIGGVLQPYDAVLSPDGKYLYVSNFQIGSVSRIDTTTGATTQVYSNRQIEKLSLSADGKTLYGTSYNEVHVIDLATATFTRVVAAPADQLPSLRTIATHPGTGQAYVVVYSAGKEVLAVINPAGQVVRETPIPRTVNAIAFNSSGTRLYATNSATDTIDVIDTSTGAVLRSIKVTGYPENIALSADGTTIYYTDTSTRTVTVVDISEASINA